jgi:hypothetical protein
VATRIAVVAVVAAAVPAAVAADARANPADPNKKGPDSFRAFLLGTPCMIDSLGVQVPFTSRWRRSDSEAQGRHREVGSEGSVEQRREPMNKNRI